MCSPRHLAVPVRLPAPLLPRPTPQPHRHHCDRHQLAPLPCMRQQAQRCKGPATGAAATGQGRGQSRGLLGPAAPQRGGRESTRAARQGQEPKVARKPGSGSRALVLTRQQEENWQTRCATTYALFEYENSDKAKLHCVTSIGNVGSHCYSSP